jgi:hypothetical protein
VFDVRKIVDHFSQRRRARIAERRGQRLQPRRAPRRDARLVSQESQPLGDLGFDS